MKALSSTGLFLYLSVFNNIIIRQNDISQKTLHNINFMLNKHSIQ